jgi:hypothetical protein
VAKVSSTIPCLVASYAKSFPSTSSAAVKNGSDGAGLRQPEQLPWPRNLFGENATIAELMAEAALIEQVAQISDETMSMRLSQRAQAQSIADAS